ncbi:MAG: A24 family peptidase [Bryobacteraceae bacterium]|nr:A24 family peptidase [Bryobacteraceae bacterium]
MTEPLAALWAQGMVAPLEWSMAAGLFGLLIGSFLNVCISRLPYDESVVTPRSHCPRCSAWIAWYDNIPLLSYVLLSGRCRHCRAAISWRYPAVEALTGGLFWLSVTIHGTTLAGLKWSVFAAILVALIFTDLETRILPDEFTKAGMVAGFLLAPVAPLPPGLLSIFWPQATPELISLLDSLAAAGLLAGGMWLMAVVYERVRKREGLGFGDVKMLALLGAFLGLESALLVMVLASLGGSVLGLIWVKLRGEDIGSYELPFGSFLGVAGLLVAFAGAGLLTGPRG